MIRENRKKMGNLKTHNAQRPIQTERGIKCVNMICSFQKCKKKKKLTVGTVALQASEFDPDSRGFPNRSLALSPTLLPVRSDLSYHNKSRNTKNKLINKQGYSGAGNKRLHIDQLLILATM